MFETNQPLRLAVYDSLNIPQQAFGGPKDERLL
jgi:hypothetical protein